MRKTVLILIAVLLFTSTMAIPAATPSTFDLGLVGYYSYASLEQQEWDDYLPGLRAQWNLLPWIGVSADAILTYAIPDWDYYEFIIILDAVVRANLGLIEPYIAIGPAYQAVVIGDYSEADEDSFAFNARGGVDVNITDYISVGAEANFLVDDVGEFFEYIADNTDQIDDLVKGYSKIGIVVKARF
ncbi:MAG: outer membrane beta-barrel protein [Sphaerochaetaceae bacterium]